MERIWQEGEATVRQVQEGLRPGRPLAYNTVLTMMRILRDKGFLESRRDGRADVYRPRISREQMSRRSIREVADRFFAGSVGSLVSQLISDGELSDEEIKAIRRKVDAKLGR